MLRRLIKLLIGIALLPAVWGVSVALYTLYRTSGPQELSSGPEVWALPSGFLLWVFLFFLLPRPFRTYVLGHELTHALWGLLMGARIGKLKVGKEGGHVELSKTNVLITLAPYFFPFYTFLVLAAYYLAGIWFHVELYKVGWLAAIGFTWSFHLTFTIHMLAEVSQPDVQEHGHLFSYVVIYLMNVLLMGLWMAVIGSPTLADFALELKAELMNTYEWVGQMALSGWHWLELHLLPQATTPPSETSSP